MDFKIILITLVLMIVGGIKANNFTNTNYKKQYEELSSESLYDILLFYDIKFPEVVFAQAILESSQFNSELFLRTNNLFGMKYPNVRKTTSIGKSKDGYAKYQHWIYSVTDYHLWQKNNIGKNIETQSEYFDLLSRNYAEDRKYIHKLKDIINRNDNFFDSIR